MILRDLILKHDIPVTTKWGVTHVLIFYNEKDHTTWAWKTTTLPYFKEHNKYSIICIDEGDYNISHVREVDFDHGHPAAGDAGESEQPDDPRPNALDILLPDMNLTNDEKYDMITAKGGEKKCLKR